MARFICETQQDRILGFKGPSGKRYVSYLGQSFNVDNEDDIKFFEKNYRFIKTRRRDKRTEVSGDSFFRKELDKIKPLSKTTKDKLVEEYQTFEECKTDLEDDNPDLSQTLNIPKRQFKVLKEHILSSEDEEDEVDKK